MKKVLIIGARGMLGQELAKVFKDLNPLLWDKQEIDITDKKQVKNNISPIHPDLIINAAAYTDVDTAETNQELANQINGQAVGYLAQTASEIGALLVHYSTDYVFDGQQEQGYQEDNQPVNPVNLYGQSKLLGEKLLEQNCQQYYLIRTSGLYGQQGKNFVETILKIAQQKDKIKVVNDQHFKSTYALDLAKQSRELIESKPDFGIYHLTNEGVISWYDFAKEICRIRADLTNLKSPDIIPCSAKDFPRPAQRPSYSILLNTKLPLLRSWPNALKDYLKGRTF